MKQFLDRLEPQVTLMMRASYQLLRLVPGTLEFRRNLRDSAWLREADAVIVSYPKSGRTFVRAMLARLYQVRFGIDERKLLEFPALRHAPPSVPRVLFTHAGGRPGKIAGGASRYERANLVLIARHPGDVAVSRYYHLKHRSRDPARRRLSEQPLKSFVWAEPGGIPSIVTFLNHFAAVPGVTIVTYEDLIGNPQRSLGRVAAAIGLHVGPDEIADAVAFGSIKNLKEREREGYFTSPRLRPARKGDARSGKVRKGTSGGFRGELPAAEANKVEAYVREHLDPRLGYSPV